VCVYDRDERVRVRIRERVVMRGDKESRTRG
jgi:hypothetical protein